MDRGFVENLVRLACEAARGSGASLYLIDGDALYPYITYQLPEEYIGGIGAVRIGTQCCGRAVEHQRPWIVADMFTDPLFADGLAGAEDSPIRAAFSVPVFERGRVVGSLACHYDAPYSPSASDIERNETFAKLIGIAIEELRQTNPSEIQFRGSVRPPELLAS